MASSILAVIGFEATVMGGLSPMPLECEAEGEASAVKGSPGAIITLIGQRGRSLSDTVGRSEQLLQLADEVDRYAQSSRAANTRRAYDSDWRDFTSWSTGLSFPIDPPIDGRQVAAYLAARAAAGLSVATLRATSGGDPRHAPAG